MPTMELPGIFTMSITPFGTDGKLDEAALRAHLRRVTSAGNGVLLGSPGSGEGQVMDTDELRRLYEIGVDELKGKVPVFAAGRESRGAKYLLEVAREAEAAGVDAVQVYPIDIGHGHRPTGAIGAAPGPELEQYYRDVLEGIGTRVHLSSHQGVGYVIPIELLDRLVRDYPHIISIMVSNDRIEYVTRVIDALGDRIKVFVSIHNLIKAMVLGAHGCLDTVSNIAPQVASSIVREFRAGNIDAATAAWARLMRLGMVMGSDRNGNFVYATPRTIKAALKVLGLPCGEMRHPFLPIPEEAHLVMADFFDADGIKQVEGIA